MSRSETKRAYWASLTPEQRAVIARRAAATRRERGADDAARERMIAMNKARAGQPLSAAHRAAIAAGNQGRGDNPKLWAHLLASVAQRRGQPLTLAHRAKLVAAHAGKPLSDAQRAAYVRNAERRRGKPSPIKGRPFTAEHKARIAVATARRMAREGIQRPTSIERIVANTLAAFGVPFIAQYRIGRYVTDFYLPDYALVIEADGDYWHRRPGAAEQDARRDAWLLAQGYRVERLWESEIHADAASAVYRALSPCLFQVPA